MLYNKQMICPYCQVKGKCVTYPIKRKKPSFAQSW